MKRNESHPHPHPDPQQDDDEMPSLQPIQGAVAGGGIGGDEVIDKARIEGQLVDVEGVVPRVEEQDKAALEAIEERIREVNARRELSQRQLAILEENTRARRALVNDVRCLLPGQLGMTARTQKAVRRVLVPLVDTFYDAFRPFLTEAYDDDATFRECFGIANVQLTDDQNLLRTRFELLLKESIVQGIDQPRVAIIAFTQLLFNNEPGRMMVSAGGSIVAIILARDILLMFANTVISVMTFGWLDLQGLTNLFGFVYHNCSLANIRNLLIYLNVTRENADLFIAAISKYNREQRQYILMSLFLFGLNSIRRGAQYDVEQIRRILYNARIYLNGVFNADADVAVPDPGQAPQDQAAAAAALNAAAAAQSNIAPPVPQPQPVNPHPTIFQIFVDSGTDILTFIHRVFRSGWMRGLRISRQCLREVFTLYLVRPPAGQGLVCDLVNGIGSVTRWGVEAIQARSAQLDPDRPNQEVIRLLAAVKGLGDDVVGNPVLCEAALYEFSQELKGFTGAAATPGRQRGAVKILQQGPEEDGALVYLTAEHLTALRTHFCQGDQRGQRGQPGLVNAERLQQACLGMRLFVFEQDMRENMVAANVVNQVEKRGKFDFNNTQDAVYSVSQSLGRFQEFILEDNETLTKSIFQKAKLRLQALANIQDIATQGMARAIGFQEQTADPREVLARNRLRNRIPSKADIKSAVLHSINSNDMSEQTKKLIREMLIPRIDDINFEGLEGYLLNQNPGAGVPDTFLQSCTAFLNSSIPERLQNAQAAIGAATRSGLSRCAALCTNVVVVSSGAVYAIAEAGVQRVRELFNGIVGPQAVIVANQAAAAAQEPVPAIQPNNEAAILVNIDNVQNIPQVEHGLSESQDAGRSRSRKRSATKRTRRKGKQSSKKLKRKSRRNQRRVSSRKGRK